MTSATREPGPAERTGPHESPHDEGAVFSELPNTRIPPGNPCKEIIVFFHGLVSDGKYPCASLPLKDWIESQDLKWLYGLEERLPGSKVYVASYERYANDCSNGKVDLYEFGDYLLQGALKVLESRTATWDTCHVILIGHSVGGLAIKQLLLQAELQSQSLTDPSLRFLDRIAGIFYFATPHAASADLTRLLVKSKSQVGAALATLGKVTGRLNLQFMERRKALGIPAAEVFETKDTKVGNFTGKVVPEASARMDVDFAFASDPEADHFSVCRIKKENPQDPRYRFLVQQINSWVHPDTSRLRPAGGIGKQPSRNERRGSAARN